MVDSGHSSTELGAVETVVFDKIGRPVAVAAVSMASKLVARLRPPTTSSPSLKAAAQLLAARPAMVCSRYGATSSTWPSLVVPLQAVVQCGGEAAEALKDGCDEIVCASHCAPAEAEDMAGASFALSASPFELTGPARVGGKEGVSWSTFVAVLEPAA